MGTNIQHTHFSEKDFERFAKRLKSNLATLRSLLRDPAFGKGKPTLGAELELTLVDEHGHAQWVNEEILNSIKDPQLTPELNRYNLEYNLSPVPTKGSPFTAIGKEMAAKLQKLNRVAAKFDSHSIAIGILPTLTNKDVGAQAMTQGKRYQVLADSLTAQRQSPFKIHIEGEDTLDLKSKCLTMEGANTSFQLHLRVHPDEFANLYNAAQLASALALAACGNSPLFLGYLLWHESRVPLFKQSIDVRSEKDKASGRVCRTGLGKNWVQNSALELFQLSVDEFPVIFPEYDDTDSNRASKNRGPALSELRLHHGSVWQWNRAIYDPADKGHLRIELRALPSGPSIIDMMANAALLIGLTQGLAKEIPAIAELMPFKIVKYNFYRSAQSGLDAELFWHKPDLHSLTHYQAPALLEHLLPIAESGLKALGVSDKESEKYLSIVQQRVTKKQTGASWQIDNYNQLLDRHPKEKALSMLVQSYLAQSDANLPVHEWEPVSI